MQVKKKDAELWEAIKHKGLKKLVEPQSVKQFLFTVNDIKMIASTPQ